MTTIKDILGPARYEQYRSIIQKTFPDPKSDISDEMVDAFVRELHRQELPGIEKLGLPDVSLEEKTSGDKSVLAGHALGIGERLWKNFRATREQAIVATTRAHTIEVPLSVKAELEQILTEGRGVEVTPRLIELLDSIKVYEHPKDFAALPNGASVVAMASAIALGSDSDGSTTGTGKRQTWANQLANQKAQPLQIFRPTSLNAPNDPQSIEAILTGALASGSAVKAAGSGHSYSDVATTPDFFIDTHGLSRVSDPANPITGQLSPTAIRGPLELALGPINWTGHDPEANRALIEMEAGITIRDLNTVLDSRNVGLMNMGGYDGQTIVGAISTSTHGSGITLPPFPDMVRSLVLATTGRWNGKTISGKDPGNGVYYYRIEPSNGITDPARYSDQLIQLIQDDDCFNAVICSMGCFGVIYSVVLEVMQMYWLEETRYLASLKDVMRDLAPNPNNPGHVPDVLKNTRNYEVLIHPYPKDGFKLVPMVPGTPVEEYDKYFMCLVTKRTIAQQPTTPPKPRVPTPDWLGKLLDLALHVEPAFTPLALDIALITLMDFQYVNRSYDIYNLALGGDVGFAAEIGFSLDDSEGNYTADNFRAAIDRIHQIAQHALEQGSQYQTSPFSLRFVNKSEAHLSMMEGQRTAMIEMDMLTGTYAGSEIMYRYEAGMYSLGGRPHWGLEFDFLSGNNDLLAKMYPKLGQWLAVYGQFNAHGTFNNRFTQRMGFTKLVT
jgi:hypothetical protein